MRLTLEITNHNPRRYLKTIILVILGCVGVGLILFLLYWFTTAPLRRKLPFGASHINDLYVERFPDYTYYLRAKISESDFIFYCKKISLESSISDARSKNEISWVADKEVSWWNPSANVSDTYCRATNDGREWVIAKYENGFIYLTAWRR